MTNTKNWLLLTLTLTCATLAGCGMEEHGTGDVCGENDTMGDVHEDDVQPDGGTASDTEGDAGSAGSDTQGDAGSTGTSDTNPVDAGAGGSTGDAGSSDTGSGDAGTGGSTGDAGAGGTGGDAGTSEPTHPAPLQSPSSCTLRFADEYIGGSACGQIRGNLPGATWTSGQALIDTNADHELEVTLSATPAGTYELTYVSATCLGGTPVAETWASYGARAQLLGMSEDARSFVSCNWWDAASGTTVSVASPGCNLRVQIDASCNVTGAGNMRNYR